MFSVEELLSKKNQTIALAHFKIKRDSCGPDKMKVSELEEYWNFNKDFVCHEIKQGTYTPGVIHNYEIVNNRGKRRIISNINVLDRFIARLIAQKLRRYLEPEFPELQFRKLVLYEYAHYMDYVIYGNSGHGRCVV